MLNQSKLVGINVTCNRVSFILYIAELGLSMFMTLGDIDLYFVFLLYVSLGGNQGSISLIDVVGKCSLYFLLEEILKNLYYFFKNLVEFLSEAIWAWAFLCGKIFNYYINFFIWYMFNQIFYFFFGQFLVICVFLEVFPFHQCPIFCHKVFQGILLL